MKRFHANTDSGNGCIARQIFCALLGLAAGLATYLLLLLLADTLSGSRQIGAWLLFESRSGFIRMLLSDLLAAMLFGVPTLLGASLLAAWGRVYLGQGKTIIVAAVLAFLIGVICMVLGFHALQAALFGAAIFAAMLASLIFARIFVCPKAG